MPSRVISIVLTGNNAGAVRAIAGVGTASQRAATQSAVAFDASTGKITSSFQRLGETAGQSMSRVGKSATTNLTLPIVAVGAAAGKMGLDFGTEIAKIEGLAGVPRAQIQGLRDDVLSLAGETAQSPQKLAQAMYFITSAGIDAADATDVLRSSAQAATAGLGDVATVAQSVVGAVNAFANQGLTAAQATDVMVATVRNATFEADALAESIGPVTAVASQMGVTFNEVGAALAVMSQGNLDAETSATALKGILTQILKPSAEATQLWTQMFGSMDNVRALLEEKGLVGVLQEMSQKVGGNQAAIAKLFPDVRGLVGALSLLGQKQSKVNDIMADFKTPDGSLIFAFETAMKTAGKDVAKGFAEAQVAAIRLGDAVGPAISTAADALGALSRGVAGLPDPLIQSGVAVAGLLAVLGPGVALGGAFVRSFSTLRDAVGAVRSKIADHGAATLSAASASDKAAVAQARLTVASQAQAQAIARAQTANAAYKVALQDATLAGNTNVTTSKALVTASAAQERAQARLAVTTREVAVASKEANAAQATGTGKLGIGAAITGAVVGIGILTAGIAKARQAQQEYQEQTKQMIAIIAQGGDAATRQAQAMSSAYGPAVAGVAREYLNAALAGKGATLSVNDLEQQLLKADPLLGQVGDRAHQLAVALHEINVAAGPSEKQTNALAAAQRQLADDYIKSKSGTAGAAAAEKRLAADRLAVFNASRLAAGTQNVVADATNRGAAAAKKGADAAEGGAAAAAHLGAASTGAAGGILATADAALTGANALSQYASGAVTAAQAVAAISDTAFAPLVTSIDLESAKAQFADANAALTAPDDLGGGGGGGGGATQTAIAAALERASKELAVRDAMRAVTTAATGVKDAELSLVQARRSSEEATRAVTAAQENLRTVLHGVSRDSKEAQDAIEALDDAQRTAAGAKLDVKDAQRGLQQAKNEKPLAQLAVQDAEAKLAESRESGADQSQITRDEIALANARIALTAVDDTIRRAELALAGARDSAQDSTKELNKAGKDLNVTLKGYGPNSREAKEAQRQLTDAQLAARQATASLTGAQQGLVAAQDNVATSALGLKRSQADLAGQLESLSSPGGAIGRAKSAMDSYKVKFGEVQRAAKTMIDATVADATRAGSTVAGLLSAEIEAIKAVIQVQPELAATFGPILDALIRKLSTIYRAPPPPVLKPGSPGITGPAAGTGFATGGPMSGKDPSGFPILAHPGEFMIQAKAVDKYGLAAMEQLNAGKLELPKFAVGGPVDNRTISRTALSRSTNVSNVRSTSSSTGDQDNRTFQAFARGGSVVNRAGDDNRKSSSSALNLSSVVGGNIDARSDNRRTTNNSVDARSTNRGDTHSSDNRTASTASFQTVNFKALPKFAASGSTGNGSRSGSLAIVHPGEYVLRESAVEKYGEKTIEQINEGKLPKFATGGPVDARSFSSSSTVTAPTTSSRSRSSSTASTVHVAVHLHGPVMGTDVDQVVMQSIQKAVKRNGFIQGTSISAMA